MKGAVVERLYLVAMTAVLGGVAWMSFTQPVASERPGEQEQLYVQVPEALDPNGVPPLAAAAQGEGSALAYIQIPRFGENWLWTVVEGTAEEDLKRGPGHYAETALPGAPGNFAVAAHRSGYGDPFLDFETLQIGDEVTFRQSGAWWTYEIFRGPEIFEPGVTWMLRQNPNFRKLTLTTCWPKYGNEKRMFVRAILTDWSGK